MFLASYSPPGFGDAAAHRFSHLVGDYLDGSKSRGPDHQDTASSDDILCECQHLLENGRVRVDFRGEDHGAGRCESIHDRSAAVVCRENGDVGLLWGIL